MFDSKESTHLTVNDFYSAAKIMMHGVRQNKNELSYWKIGTYYVIRKIQYRYCLWY